ncbi:MAG TPA: hypothetical protein PK101_01195, partial [Thauera sp.]|nr:hypothetical protein [Thauera sp.]
MQPRQPRHRGRIALVGDVVGPARERIDRLHRFAQARRQQQGGDREVLVVLDGHRGQGSGRIRKVPQYIRTHLQERRQARIGRWGDR